MADDDIVDSVVKDAVTQPNPETGGANALAAGVMFLAKDSLNRAKSQVLLLRRAGDGDHTGEWAFPGGGIEEGETAIEGALRECQEEIGYTGASGGFAEWCRRIADGVDFTTFVAPQAGTLFQPILNDEHDAFVWAALDNLPQPLHPGVQIAIDCMTMNELDCARAIIDGRLASGHHYINVWLFDIRITGTGAAYRDSINEYAWRSPDLYLNDDFLVRCQGLQAIFEHPEKTMLTSDEFKDRTVGAVMIPYIDREGLRHSADEVWGITKVHDADAAYLMRNRQMSTSPGVILRGGTPRQFETLSDGTKVLVENDAALLDHIAICEAGVWDKTTSPRGVNITGGLTVADEAKTEAELKTDADKKDAAEREEKDRADAARRDASGGVEPKNEILDAVGKMIGDAFGKLDAKVDAACARMDAHRKDEGKTEDEGNAAEMAADKAKKDAADKDEREKADARKDAERRDAEEKERMDASRKDAEEVKRRLDEAEDKLRSRSDSEEKELADAQMRADSVLRSMGNTAGAPRYLAGENARAYRARLARSVQDHDPNWKGKDLSIMSPDVFDVAENQIWDSARRHAEDPLSIAADGLVGIETRSGGHIITEYKGRPRDWMDSFAGMNRNHVANFTQL